MMLDAVFVTSNVKVVDQGAANVRLPTDKDRKIQIEGLAVNPQNKVAASWGAIKQQYR
jgi:hypothetical protein